ncbi:hypothetical protein GCM10017744_042420 [Streptomyces antimycoticus]|uniref:Uncharacterized protein n=1 Tax=Streptomyces antimycoticus TaxID=68175 RepID=A0A4D4KFL1_9ACTN|nr:hypothetical protein [Streptomyces antimycoticus]GDY45117.1 hypothetical protein SANT12839_059990 [Streptomyces antimycoticus]
MPTAIAVTGRELVLPPPDGQTPSAVVLRPPDAQSLDDALAEVGNLLDQQGYLVVLYPAATPAAVVRRLHIVRSVLESDRMALLSLELPPLAVAVLARQLRQLSMSDFSPGVLACAARLLSHYIHAGALLGSVARLDRVPVSLTSHVKSWVPGSHFGVLAHPTPRLVKVGGASELPAPGYATSMTVARGQLNSHGYGGGAGPDDWVTGALAPAWGVRGVEEVRLPAESARWWGTPKLIEFAAAIPDLSVLYQLVASVRREECHWCGFELIGDRCAFCSCPVARGDEIPALLTSPRPALTSR